MSTSGSTKGNRPGDASTELDRTERTAEGAPIKMSRVIPLSREILLNPEYAGQVIAYDLEGFIAVAESPDLLAEKVAELRGENHDFSWLPAPAQADDQ